MAYEKERPDTILEIVPAFSFTSVKYIVSTVSTIKATIKDREYHREYYREYFL